MKKFIGEEESPQKPDAIQIIENEDKPPILQGRRRESSYTDALDDPLRYLDQVKKYLAQTCEDEDLVATANKGKVPQRTKSGNLIEHTQIQKTLLEDIDEEVIPVEKIKPKEVDFIKN